jgi:enoyl-CoA hydratase
MINLVDYQCRDGVARIIMDDGRVNIMSTQMLQSLHEAFDRASEDRAIAVLSSGRPGIFSAGFDLKVFAARDVAGSIAMVKSGADLILKLLAFDTPVISICAGHAYPMGAFLLLSSDLRLGVEGPYGIGFNEVIVGIPVPGFALELGRSRLHPAWLSRTATIGEMYGPSDAVTAGFLDRAVPEAEIEDALVAAIAGLRQVHQPSHAMVKRRLRADTISAMRAAVEAEITVAAYEEVLRGAAGGRPATSLPER